MMTRAILARDLKPGDIIKWNLSLMVVLTEEMGNNETIVFRLLSGTKIITKTFWKDVDLVNIYDPALVELWQ